jgi:hypothetical protein
MLEQRGSTKALKTGIRVPMAPNVVNERTFWSVTIQKKEEEE